MMCMDVEDMTGEGLDRDSLLWKLRLKAGRSEGFSYPRLS